MASVTDNVWFGRIVIIVIIGAAAFMLGTFMAQIKNEKDKTSPTDAKVRTQEYQRIGVSAGVLLGIFWVLYVASKDHAKRESGSTQDVQTAVNSMLAASPARSVTSTSSKGSATSGIEMQTVGGSKPKNIFGI